MQNHLDLDEIWVIARRKERLEAWPSLYKEQKFRILPLDLQKKEDVECLKQTLEETQPHIELLFIVPALELWERFRIFPWKNRQRWSM